MAGIWWGDRIVKAELWLVLAAALSLGCTTQSGGDDGGNGGASGSAGSGSGGAGGSGGSGGSLPNVPSECVADELDGTWQGEAVFNTEPGTLATVSVTFANAQLSSFDGMACTPHALDVPPEYPGCNQGWDCGPCFCQISVPGFGENLWTVKCSDPDWQWDQCAQYKYVDYELGPYDGSPPSTGGTGGAGGSGGASSCGDCSSCYDDCSYSCDGYPGSCVTTCMASCDKCCSW